MSAACATSALWLLTECICRWERSGETISVPDLLAAAADAPAGVPLFDVDATARRCLVHRAHGAGAIRSRLAGRSILTSLAAAYARTLRQAAELSDAEVRVVHIVCGGSPNELLCRLPADATGIPVARRWQRAHPVARTRLHVGSLSRYTRPYDPHFRSSATTPG